MASWGLAFEYGKKAYTDMMKRQEELDRYLAERALWDARRQEAEEQQATDTMVNREIRKSTEAITANKQAILAGNDEAFIDTLNTLASASGGKYEKRKDGKLVFMKDGKQIGEAIDLKSKDYKDGATRLSMLTNRLDSAVKIRDTYMTQAAKDKEYAHDMTKHKMTQDTQRRGQDLTYKAAHEKNEIYATDVANTLALGLEANEIKKEANRIEEKKADAKAASDAAGVSPKPKDDKAIPEKVLNQEAARVVFGDGTKVSIDEDTNQFSLVGPDNVVRPMTSDEIADLENAKTDIVNRSHNQYLDTGTTSDIGVRGVANTLQKERLDRINKDVEEASAVARGLGNLPHYSMYPSADAEAVTKQSYYGPGKIVSSTVNDFSYPWTSNINIDPSKADAYRDYFNGISMGPHLGVFNLNTQRPANGMWYGLNFSK